METADKLLNVRDVAVRLGVSGRQIFKLASMGQIPAPLKLSRSTRWRESDIARFIRSGCDMRVFAAEVERREAVEASNETARKNTEGRLSTSEALQ